ncbi:MAG: hypothetical protein ISR82_05690 [Candidatus Marinimicrobia bacterium]|nr:hypothetical protein [Candidatus Neomarinimicrobiota bacterium]MBL7010695.1 hypothetical protein [Candidatus Neomarinimicrobiota bacterium]MBL7030693.1 hypothetical protein [Candidatus Neomarinimicrobiota bacterium]
MNQKYLLISFVFITQLSGSSFPNKNRINPEPEMVGHWEGYGHEIVNWSKADSIFFSLEIFPDGRVSGTVGDAILKNGYIRLNLWMNRKLGNPQYLIGGDLEGNIVEKENIYRKKLKYLILDFVEGKYVGGFHTSGTFTHPWAGNDHWKKHMHMTGVDVVLLKTGFIK